MSKSENNFSRKRKNETFYKAAKQINVRARSYFKLEQVDTKYKLIKSGQTIIDLGAAPGGWLEYLDKKMEDGKIVGIDLLEIKKHHEFSEKVEILEDNFDNIEDYNFGEFDVVLSDMAPEFSGDLFADRGRCHKLNMKTLTFCKKHLRFGGHCVFKSFEGEDLDEVRTMARTIFKVVKNFKPQSSQKKSTELFMVCFGKKSD